MTSRRLRDGGTTISYSYDSLNRLHTKVLPEGTVTYGYDLFSHLSSVSQGATALSYTYDQLGRNLNQTGPLGTVSSQWDLAGHRTKLSYPDASYVNYDYLVTGDLLKVRENGATTGVGVLATYAYDALGNRTSVTFGNGAVQTYAYDTLFRLKTLKSDLEGAATVNDVQYTLGYNPSSQITSDSKSNDKYAWIASSRSYNYVANALNQYSSNGSTSFSYDSKANLHASGTTYYCYDSENRLIAVGSSANCSSTASLSYDPAGRLSKVSGASTSQFVFDGVNIIAEYDGSPTPQLAAKYVFGASVDEPIVSYDSAGNRTFLIADERGSIVALTNSSGTVTAINSYDEYGIPKTDSSGNSLNAGRFQFTGQAWLKEIGLYYFKSRMYSATLGRFLQPDAIGYGDGPNIYAYVHNDPVNADDPSGTCDFRNSTCADDQTPIFVTGSLPSSGIGGSGGADPATTGGPTLPTLQIPSFADTQCANALKGAKKDMAGVNRAKAAWDTIKKAAAAAGISPALLAAVGVQETDFRDINQSQTDPNLHGRGVFQIDGGQNPQVSYADAHNLSKAASWAAKQYGGNMHSVGRAFPSFTPTELLEATALAYNEGFRGFENRFNIGGFKYAEAKSAPPTGNYGTNVVNLMSCFQGMK